MHTKWEPQSWKSKKARHIPIYKDQEWWDNNVHKFIEFWNKVIKYRETGFSDLLPKPRISKNKEKIVECQIISDDESKKEDYCINNENCYYR